VCNENGNEARGRLRRAFGQEDRGSPVGDDRSSATDVRFADQLGERDDFESQGSGTMLLGFECCSLCGISK
jgi:hypothetical protein